MASTLKSEAEPKLTQISIQLDIQETPSEQARGTGVTGSIKTAVVERFTAYIQNKVQELQDDRQEELRELNKLETHSTNKATAVKYKIKEIWCQPADFLRFDFIYDRATINFNCQADENKIAQYLQAEMAQESKQHNYKTMGLKGLKVWLMVKITGFEANREATNRINQVVLQAAAKSVGEALLTRYQREIVQASEQFYSIMDQMVDELRTQATTEKNDKAQKDKLVVVVR